MSPFIVDCHIDSASYPQAVSQILAWGKQHDSRSVYAANLHMLLEKR
jgi:hypothetical protein